MSGEPMWRLLHQCALKLTQSRQVPFTRGELIACVRQTAPNAMENSINPIIQGITDNLKGGAPGADGKKILHSVGRGKFVLRAAHRPGAERLNPSGSPVNVGLPRKKRTARFKPRLPESENELRDRVLALLREHLCDTDCLIEAEGRVLYRVPSGQEFGHASDILVSTPASAKRVSIELKFKSAVTDQFKCRAYDAIHMKQQHGDALLVAMLYAKTDSGISIERARSICYSYDRFYGGPATRFLSAEGIDDLATDVRRFLFGESETHGA